MRLGLSAGKKQTMRTTGLLTATALAAAVSLSAPLRASEADGVWLVDNKVAVQTFDCGQQMCGRIVWLVRPRNGQGRLDRDIHNPDPDARGRPLCELTVIWDLKQTGPGQWDDGRFYDPQTGGTYQVRAEMISRDVIKARIYRFFAFLGQTKLLRRVEGFHQQAGC
jgi:uncharacterized protein (DUF2147 family)